MHTRLLHDRLWYRQLSRTETVTARFGDKTVSGAVSGIRTRHESFRFEPEIRVDTGGGVICVRPDDLVIE